MEKEIMKAEIVRVIQSRLHITIENPDENFFSKNLNIRPIDMVCLLLEFGRKFKVEINDRFINNLPCITLNYLADALVAGAENS